jgi:hypothetical protein
VLSKKAFMGVPVRETRPDSATVFLKRFIADGENDRVCPDRIEMGQKQQRSIIQNKKDCARVTVTDR